MISPDDAERDYLSRAMMEAPSRKPATFGEIWDAQWAASGLETITGVGKPLADSVAELRSAIEGAGGDTIDALAVRAGVNLGAAGGVDRRIYAYNQIADSLPEDARKTIDPLRDARRRSEEKARNIEREAGEVTGSTYGIAPWAVGFVAGAARQAIDPPNIAANIATAPFGGPFKGPLLRVFARQIAAGAGAQVVVEPYIQSRRGELGLEAGFGHAAANVAGAALFAGGVTAVVRTAAFGLRALGHTRAVGGEILPDSGPRGAEPAPHPPIELPTGDVRPIEHGPPPELGPQPLSRTGRMFDAGPQLGPQEIGRIAAEDVDAFNRGDFTPTKRPAPEPEIMPLVPGWRAAEPSVMPQIPGWGERPGAPVELPARDPYGPPPTPDQPFERTPLGPFTREEGRGVVAPEPPIPPAQPVAAGRGAPPPAPGFEVPPSSAMEATRTRRPPEPRPPFEGLPPMAEGFALPKTAIDEPPVGVGRMDHPDGDTTPTYSPGDIGTGGWRAFDDISAEDLDALALLMERNDVIDAAASRAWDRTTHVAMVEEATAALEEGRPIDRARVAEGLKAEGIEPLPIVPVPANELSAAADSAIPVTTKQNYFGVHKTPPERYSLFQFIASIGGIRKDDPMIADVLQLLGGKNKLVPGFGPLIRNPRELSSAARAGGKQAPKFLDEIREAAVISDFLQDESGRAGGVSTSTIPDLLAKMDDEARGNRQYRPGFERVDKQDALQKLHEVEQAVASHFEDLGMRPADVDRDLWDKMVNLIDKENLNPGDAYDRVVMADYHAGEARKAKRRGKAKPRAARAGEDIPFPGEPAAADQRGAGARVGAEPTGARPGGEPGRTGEQPPAGESVRPTGDAETGRGRTSGGGAAAEAGPAKPVGDAALAADADRLDQLHGGNAEAIVTGEDGRPRRVRVSDAVAEARDRATAAEELTACVGGKVAKEGEP